MMSKTFHGKVDETVDALIILEACRQGVLPRITRRLLAAERGETRPLPNPPSEASSSSSSSSSPPTRMSSQLPVSAPATAASISFSSLSSETAYSSPSSSTMSSPPAATSSPSITTTTNPSLIIPGSVFVFDEEESGICRWTDGKIWSPSRICDNFLVYRELYRKLPNQKCYTASDKVKMKDGSGLKDQALKEKVDKENLVVMGCMKGTFVLKKGGLVKKTICVKGINMVPPEELKRRLEEPALGLSSSSSSSGKRGGRAGRRGRGYGGGNGRNLLPGFSTRGTQHLVCYEMPGEMDELHGPREYLELRDLPISKTFVMMQSYRVSIQILPLGFGQQPLDPADEYIHSSRIFQARARRQSIPLASSNTASEGPFKRRKIRESLQRKRVEKEVEEGESENESDYLVDDTNSNSGDAYYDSEMMAASGPIPSPVAPPTQSHSVAPLYHNYPIRGQNRYTREQIRQQLMEPWSPSPLTELTPKGKKRAMPLSRSLVMETEDTSAVKVEKSSPSLEFSYSAGRSAESGGSLQYGLAVEDDEMGGGQYGVASGMPSSSVTTRGTPTQMHELLQSMDTIPLQGDNELKAHGYKTAECEWRLVTSSRSSTSNSAINDPLVYSRSTYNPGHAQPQPLNAYPFHEGHHWQQQYPSYSPQRRSYDLVVYNQINSQRTYPGLYTAQQPSMHYNEPQPHFQPQDESQYQTPPQQQAFSSEAATYCNAAPASTTMMPPIQDLQGYYSLHAGAEHYGQPFPLGSDTTSAAASDVIQHADNTEMECPDDAGYSPVQQPSARAERKDSPWSSGSVYSRSSSLSTSLTLSPVVRPQAPAGQDARPSTGPKAENQSSPVAKIANERQDVSGMPALTGIGLWHDDESLYARPIVMEHVQSTITTTSSSSQGQIVSVSFKHTARSSSAYIAPTATPISVQAATAMPKPMTIPNHTHGSAAASTSVTHAVDANHHDQKLSSPSEQNPQLQDQPFQATNRTFHRLSLLHVPVMSFSSGTVLGTCFVDSRQRSPMTPREEAMHSVAPDSEFQAAFPEVGANESLIQEQEQEQFVTDDEERGVEPHPPQMQESPTSKPPTQSSNEALFTSAGTTPAMTASHQVQRPSYSAAGLCRESVEASPLPHQTDSGPYPPQPRREYVHPPSSLFHDLDERDELDRLLDYNSQQMDTLGHDESEMIESHADDGGRLRKTGGYDGLDGSERTVQQTIPPSIDARMEGEPQPSGRPQLMSPETLSALHHYSQNEPSSMKGDSGELATGPVDPTAPSLSMVTSSGSLGQDEYLLHQTRPHISKHIRRHENGTGTGIGTYLGIGFGSLNGYGYMPGSGGSGSTGGLRSSDAGTDTGGQYDRSEDLPWAMSRQEDTTSSEVACQLFSGLGPAQGRGQTGEGHVYASGIGVGIGTTIGGSRSGVVRFEHGGHGSSGEAVNGRAQSVQTLQLSDPMDRYSFGDELEESSSRSASASSAREEEVQEEESGYSPREMLLHGGRSHGANRLRLDDTLIKQEEVKEEDDEDDELGVLELYSEHFSERGSLAQEHYDNDDNGKADEDMGQRYEGEVGFAGGQVGDQRDVGYEVDGTKMFDELPSSQEPNEFED